jgi:acyl-CoA synthetase (AMP-forming)/AMP-acid ligase II
MGPGDRLAIMLPNVLQYPVVVFGALRAGLVIVNCNPLYTARELEYQLRDSGATAIVVLENAAHIVQETIGKTALRTVIVTRIGDMLPPIKAWAIDIVVKYVKRMVAPWQIDGALRFKKVLVEGEQLALAPVSRCQDDIAFLQYTGGTTWTGPRGQDHRDCADREERAAGKPAPCDAACRYRAAQGAGARAETRCGVMARPRRADARAGVARGA